MRTFPNTCFQVSIWQKYLVGGESDEPVGEDPIVWKSDPGHCLILHIVHLEMKLNLGVIYEPDFSSFDFEHDYRAWEPGSGPNRDADVELMVGNQDRRSGEIHLGPFGFYSHWSTSGQGSLGRRKDSAGYLFQVRFPTSDFPKNAAPRLES